MIEWLALILLIPAILVPIVLLFGFAGCNIIFGLEPTIQVVPTFETTLGQELQQANRCIVQRIEQVRLTVDGSGVQIVVQRPTMGMLLINSLFISRVANPPDMSANRYDSAAEDLTSVLSEPLPLAPDPDKPLVELPAPDYVLDSTQPLLLAFDIGADSTVPCSGPNIPGSDAKAYLGPPPPPSGDPIHEAGIPDRQSGYDNESRIYLVKRIDALGD